MNLILLLQLLIQVENQALDPRAIGEANERGLFQITPIALRHVNEVYDKKYTLVHLTNTDTAMRIGALYLTILSDMYKKETGRDITVFNLVRCWNGGPQGWKRVSTLDYWQTFYRTHGHKIYEVMR